MLHIPLRSLRSASRRPRSTPFSSRPSCLIPPCRLYTTPTPDSSTAPAQTQSKSKTTDGDDPSSESLLKQNRNETPEQSSEPRATSTTNPTDADANSPVLSAAEAVQLDKVKQMLREWTESTSRQIRTQADAYTARAVKTFSQLGAELNKVTGYEEIESLKKRVVAQEERINASRHAAKTAKEEYDNAVRQRSQSQKEVNDLLQRKSSWTDDDVLRFTALVRQDHLFEQSEARAKAVAAQTEAEVEREFSELMRAILHRYHEEQVWSDKIRSVSTYGSLTVLGLNLLVFILAIIIVEPWKRKRLAQTFERKVEEMTAETLAAYEGRTAALEGKLKGQDEMLGRILETVYYANQPSAFVPPTEDIKQAQPADGEMLARPTEMPPMPEKTPGGVWTIDPQLLVVATATTAAVLGWVARGWLGH